MTIPNHPDDPQIANTRGIAGGVRVAQLIVSLAL
jgi:hypothetical protein